MKDTKGVRQVLAETIQVRRVGRATDPKPKDQVWFTTQMQDLFVLDFDALEAALQEIMLGMLPEKRDESASQCLRHWSDDPSLPCTCDDGDPKAKGFNTAVKLTEQNIRGGFKV